jgi:hypothetical protein
LKELWSLWRRGQPNDREGHEYLLWVRCSAVILSFVQLIDFVPSLIAWPVARALFGPVTVIALLLLPALAILPRLLASELFFVRYWFPFTFVELSVAVSTRARRLHLCALPWALCSFLLTLRFSVTSFKARESDTSLLRVHPIGIYIPHSLRKSAPSLCESWISHLLRLGLQG